jgi:hypothetical protein
MSTAAAEIIPPLILCGNIPPDCIENTYSAFSFPLFYKHLSNCQDSTIAITATYFQRPISPQAYPAVINILLTKLLKFDLSKRKEESGGSLISAVPGARFPAHPTNQNRNWAIFRSPCFSLMKDEQDLYQTSQF